jgi:hypothetical protein
MDGGTIGVSGTCSSLRQIEEVMERIDRLYSLHVHQRMGDFPDDLLRRHARRLASRPPSAGALIQEPARGIETACFLRYCLLMTTDRLLIMVRRQVAALWRRAATGQRSALRPFCCLNWLSACRMRSFTVVSSSSAMRRSSLYPS